MFNSFSIRLINAIEPAHRARFFRETREFLYQRVSIVLWLGLALIPSFSFLDFISIRSHFVEFFRLRAGCTVLFAGLLIFHGKDREKRFPLLTALLAYLLAGGMISFMVVQTGGYDSFYYVGLILVLIACNAILPLDMEKSMVAGILLYLVYLVPIFFLNTPTDNTLRVFYANNFFFVSLIILSVVGCHADTVSRIQKFNLRMNLDSQREKLSYYARYLETEVDKRAKELEDSELRFRLLYDNIVDMVILVDEQGAIVMANPRFYETITSDDAKGKKVPLQQFLQPGDREVLESEVFRRLRARHDVQNVQFRLIGNAGTVYNVECSAKSIVRDNVLIGYQLVIRDVTERKNLEERLLESYQDLNKARAATIFGLAKLSEFRDIETGSHLERICEYVRIIAGEFRKKPEYRNYITDKYMEDIYNSSVLHDIGKVGVPDSILLKPGPLTKPEFEIMKRHTTIGGDAIRAIEAQIGGRSYLTLARNIAYFHHERWDGAGYPYGLKGKAIPLSTRFVALADVYDALTSKRVYKEAFSHDTALKIIAQEKGKQFAPDVVDAFLKHEKMFRKTLLVQHSEIGNNGKAHLQEGV